VHTSGSSDKTLSWIIWSFDLASRFIFAELADPKEEKRLAINWWTLQRLSRNLYTVSTGVIVGLNVTPNE